VGTTEARSLLPSRVAIGERESLDSFLERLAAANDLLPPELLRLLTAPDALGSPTSAFLMIKPDPLIVDRIVRLSGVGAGSVRRATFCGSAATCLSGSTDSTPVSVTVSGR
jgi:hypothetical protein